MNGTGQGENQQAWHRATIQPNGATLPELTGQTAKCGTHPNPVAWAVEGVAGWLRNFF